MLVRVHACTCVLCEVLPDYMYTCTCTCVIHVYIRACVIVNVHVLYYRGYEVQFLPVNDSPLDSDGFPVLLPGSQEPFNDDIPMANEVVSLTTNEPIGFCYRYDGSGGGDTMPQYIIVDGEHMLNNTLLKMGSSYVIVTIAYTQMVG